MIALRVPGSLADPPLDPSRRRGAVAAAPRAAAPGVPPAEPRRAGCSTGSQRQLDRGLDAAAQAPPLSTFAAMLVVPAARSAALVWLVSRARRTARGAATRRAPVLDRRGRHRRRAAGPGRGGAGRGPARATPLVDGFRALAVRQVERGRLDDAPGATAHEVAARSAAAYPEQRGRVRRQRAALRRWCSTATGRPRREQAARVLGPRRRAGGAPMSRGSRPPAAAPARRGLVAPAPRRPGRRWPGRGRWSWSLLGGGARTGDPAGPRQPRTGRRPGAWPGCSTTRASTSRGPRRRRARRRPTSAAGTTVRGHLDRATSATSTIERLLDHTRRRPTGAWSGPGPGVADALGRRRAAVRRRARRRPARPAAPTRASTGLTAARSTAALAYPGRRLLRRRGTARSSAEPRDGSRCFGAAEALTNDQVLRADNAAVALRLLGQRRPAGLVRPRRSTTSSATTASACATLLPRWIRPACGCGAIAVRRPGRSGGPAGSGRWPPSRCRWSSRPSRPPAAGAGSTARPATGPRRRGAARGPPAPGSPSGCACGSGRRPGRPGPRRGPAHRPPGRRGRRAARPGRRPHPSTDHDLITLANDLAALDREVRRT